MDHISAERITNRVVVIKWEQMIFLGNPEYGCELHPIDFAAVARTSSARASRSATLGSCGDKLAEGLATPGPVLLEAICARVSGQSRPQEHRTSQAH